MYPTHRKDADILASHRLMADIRNYMVSSAGYDEKDRLREAIAKAQKAINDGQSLLSLSVIHSSTLVTKG